MDVLAKPINQTVRQAEDIVRAAGVMRPKPQQIPGPARTPQRVLVAIRVPVTNRETLPPHTTHAVQVLEVVLLPPLQNPEPAAETPTERHAEQTRCALEEVAYNHVFQTKDNHAILTPVGRQGELYNAMAAVLALHPQPPILLALLAIEIHVEAREPLQMHVQAHVQLHHPLFIPSANRALPAPMLAAQRTAPLQIHAAEHVLLPRILLPALLATTWESAIRDINVQQAVPRQSLQIKPFRFR